MKCARRGCRNRFDAPPKGRAGRKRKYCSNACNCAAKRDRRNVRAVWSSRTPEWYTPPDVFAEYAAIYGPFDLDPCADPRSPIWPLVPEHWTVVDDGLAQPWNGRVWLNPPYGREIGRWTARAAEEVAAGRASVVVCLVPARTDTAWWAAAVKAGAIPCFRTGRVRFLRPDGTTGQGAAFPSAVLVFGVGGADPEFPGRTQ